MSILFYEFAKLILRYRLQYHFWTVQVQKLFLPSRLSGSARYRQTDSLCFGVSGSAHPEASPRFSDAEHSAYLWFLLRLPLFQQCTEEEFDPLFIISGFPDFAHPVVILYTVGFEIAGQI